MSSHGEVATAVPQRSLWEAVLRLPVHSKHARVLSGSIIMLVGSAFVSLMNFGYNVAVARLLGPADFSHAAAAVTLLMLASCINLAFQLVTAKLIAKSESPGVRAGIYTALLKRSWAIGLAVGTGLAVASGPLSSYLRFPSPMFLIVLAAGLVFYVPLGAKRGGMQGTCHFHRLAISLTLEAVLKLIAAVALVWMGFGVMGAVAGISISVILAYFLPAGDKALRTLPASGISAPFREALQAIIFFVGQVIINNVDILLVKHYFAADQAGLYAAIALVGRLLYFASWSVTSAMFPVSAGEKVEEDSRRVLVVPLVFVCVISCLFVVLLATVPHLVIQVLFGSGFHFPNVDIEGLLTMNAVAMGVYALSVVLITYEMSRRIANTSWLQLLVSGLVIVGVVTFHASLMQVIVVQQVLRALLLIAVSAPFFRQPHAYVQEAV
jgi:O-antigen/teichoic acid export membrane protein